jgi:asparagine synthase (glutamine-hydrolysing)
LDEGHYIKIVSDYTGYPNHSVYIDENNIEKDLKQICHYQEQPFGSSSIMSQWQVFKLARENNTTVLLDGQGADEVLGGYDWFYYVYLKELFRKNCSEFFKEKRAYENLRQKKQRSFLHTASDIYLSPVFAVLGNINRKIRVPEYLNDLHPDFVALYKNEPVPFDPKRNLNEALYYSATIYGLSKLLRFADRNSMAHSVEVRLPFLYHELVEFCFSLPSEFKQHNGWSKYILRKAIDPYMPNEITWRKNKLGFLPPEKDFLESRVSKNYIADSVNFLKQNKIISAAKPEKNWRYLELNFLLRDA